jgi:hypothetical protein
MRDADRYKLLGTYRTPRVRVGRVLLCHVRDCPVVVTGWSAGRIPWPKGRPRGRRGRAGFVVFGALAAAVRRESNQAVAYWFGAPPSTVSKWRRALAVRAMNRGTTDLRRAYGQEEWFAEARAKGSAAPWTKRRRARMSKRFKGKSLPPRVAAAVRTAQRKRRGARHTAEARAKMRAAAARRLARGEVPNGRAWTPDQDAVVKALPAAEAARGLGRPVGQVYKRRRKLKVPDGRRK